MSNESNIQPENPSEQEIHFFAAQKAVEPRMAKGRYRTIKNWVIGLGMVAYYAVPFLRWDRGDSAPDQAVLLDMAHRRGYFFGFEIWPQEVYYLTGVLVIAALFLFFSTALFGRVWCGYLCFQTVWSDLFRLVEHWLQGDRNERIKRNVSGKWSFDWLWRKTITHILWVFIAMFTAGAFVLYFNDAPTLLHDTLSLQFNWSIWMWVAILTGTTYIMAGYAREQVCTYMCPYARFQSAMLDPHSWVISYEAGRGEPRGKKTTFEADKGHCIDCSLCVQVCPMGIDIRNGLQLECIACGLCVDACDSVMDKLKLPRGLVRYDTSYNMVARAKGQPEIHTLIRPRTIYYSIVVSAVLGLMLYGQLTRAPFELHAIHDRNPLYVQLSDGTIRNGYDIKILNKTHLRHTFKLAVAGVEGAKIDMQFVEGDSITTEADGVSDTKIFIAAPEQSTPQTDIVFTVTRDDGMTDEHKSVFISREENR